MMRILFVSSGNSKNGISPIVLNQGNSLKKQGHSLDFFTIKGKGKKSYFKTIFRLRRLLRQENYDVVHAHYAYSGIVAGLASRSAVLVSLMGSDIYKSGFLRTVIRIFSRLVWKAVIVKSERMQSDIAISRARIIPNGVDMERFRPIDRGEALNFTGWNPEKKHILFAANPARREKNFHLARAAMEYLNPDLYDLHHLRDQANEDVPYFYNAADVVILTSYYEGSPNVIKEAMACNRPLVSTDVGDVKDLFRDIEGCFICEREALSLSEKIKMAAALGSSRAREHIPHLSSTTIAGKLLDLYRSVCPERS